jgi:cell wall-associated NlpC family hydrolase
MAAVALMGAAASLAAVAAMVGATLSGGTNGIGAASSGNGGTSTVAATIPEPMRTLYVAAASTCPGLPWTILAAIGTVESDNGQSNLPGVHSGANAAGAEGPMQFEPATFAAYALPIPPGGATPPNPYDPTDAVYAASRLLCADGASGGRNLAGAVYAYNHSQAYVTKVFSLAETLGGNDSGNTVGGLGGDVSAGSDVGVSLATPAGAVALVWALGEVGTPYVWGGETPGVGFDCSGLVQAAYRAAGLSLPRVAQNQYDRGPLLPVGNPLQPGDLVFFGGGPGDVTHVGIYAGSDGSESVMVDAPHTGARVRVEVFPATVGAVWGDDVVVGFTRPAA